MTPAKYEVHDPEHNGVLLLSASAVLVSVVVVIVRSRNFYFFSDDFLNFVIAADMGLSWRYLLRDVFGQFVPFYRLANAVYLHLFGLYFWPFRCLLVLFEWVAIGLVSRLAWQREVGVVAMLPILALLTLSPVFVTVYQWWSAALSVLSSAIASLLCIVLVAQEEASGPGKFAAAVCFLSGLLFYPKGLFTIVLMLGVRLFMRAAQGRSRAGPMLLGSLYDVWPTLVIVPVYLGIVHFGHYSSQVVRPDLATLLRFIWIGWNRGFLTATLGLQYGSAGLAAANILVFALVLWSVSRNPATVILWAGFAVYFVISIGVVGWNRAVPFGLAAAEIARYYADILCLFLALLVLALGRPVRGRGDFGSPRLAVIVFATIFAAIELLKAGESVPHLWYAGADRPAVFVTNVRAALHAAGGDGAIADGAVPDDIMPAWMSPLNRYALFVRLFGWHGRVVTGQDATSAFDQEGNLAARK